MARFMPYDGHCSVLMSDGICATSSSPYLSMILLHFKFGVCGCIHGLALSLGQVASEQWLQAGPAEDGTAPSMPSFFQISRVSDIR